MNNLSSLQAGISNVLAGKNGITIVGILVIGAIVITDKVLNSDKDIAGSVDKFSFSVKAAGLAQASIPEVEIEEQSS